MLRWLTSTSWEEQALLIFFKYDGSAGGGIWRNKMTCRRMDSSQVLCVRYKSKFEKYKRRWFRGGRDRVQEGFRDVSSFWKRRASSYLCFCLRILYISQAFERELKTTQTSEDTRRRRRLKFHRNFKPYRALTIDEHISFFSLYISRVSLARCRPALRTVKAKKAM